MRAVREALGEDAIIVATREDEGAGGVRVTAAIDDFIVPEDEKPITAPEGSEALEVIAEALTHHQVHTDLAEKLMATATQFAEDDPLVCLAAAIDTHFRFEPLNKTKPLMLVGPPGAGKTLCTAKFATETTMAKRQATVVSTDLERAGGLEQLAAFTRLLKVNLVEIDEWYALRDLLSVQAKNPVFIDMAGRNVFDPEEKQITCDFIKAVGDATIVLPAGLDASEAIDLAHEFKSAGATKLIVTRLDAVRRIGSLLRLAHEAKLPITSYSASCKVTDAPQPMNPVVLARLLLHTKKSSATAAPADRPRFGPAAVGGAR
jgi:flagellar biosynthesis protein FlhF